MNDTSAGWRPWVVPVALVVAAVAIAIVVGELRPERTPIGLGPPVARAAPDPGGGLGGEPAVAPFGPWMLPRGTDCLDLEREQDRVHLCWTVERYGEEKDQALDDYGLRIEASFREVDRPTDRVVVLADLIGKPASGVFDTWPRGGYLGPCESVPVRIDAVDVGNDLLCGRTVATTDRRLWTHSVAWECGPCRAGERPDRAIVVWVWVAVPAGATPAWDVYADVGT